MYNFSTKDTVRFLSEKGFSLREIEQVTGISRSTASRILNPKDDSNHKNDSNHFEEKLQSIIELLQKIVSILE